VIFDVYLVSLLFRQCDQSVESKLFEEQDIHHSTVAFAGFSPKF
jgi:hypothetical protein